MSVVPYAYECYKSSVLQYKEYTLRITDNALVIHKEGADEDITIGPGILPIEQPDGTIVETDLNQYLQALQNRVTKVENNYLDAPFFTTDRDYMFSCMASNGLQETREVIFNEALETIIYHVKRLLSIDHGVHFDPRSTLFNIPMIENSHLTFKEDTLYNALNAAFAYILGHEQVQNSGIAIYLDKVMLKKPLTFTEDGPKATGIVGDGTLLTKEYLASHVGEFFSTNDSISTTPEVILLKKPITFDVEGKTKATGIAGDGVLLTKEYLKKNINDFVEVVKDKESGLKFNPLSFIFDIANAGATAASWISLQGHIDALWTFIGARDGIQTVTAALELIPGGKGGFVLSFKNLVTTVLTNAKSAVGFTIHNARMYWQLGTAWLRAIPRDADDKKEDQVDLNVPTVIVKLRELYPSFVEFIKSVNDSISTNSITLDKEFQGIDYIFCSLAELAKKVEENKNNGGRTALEIAGKADKSYVDEEIRKVVSKEYTLPQSVILKTIKGPEKDMYPGDGTTVKVNERVSFPSGIDAKEVYINGENINTTLIPLKNNEFTEPLTIKSIRSREDKPVIINKIGADNDQPVQIKKIRADDIILNYTLGSSAPLPNPSTSVRDTLNSLDSKCTNIEGHVRNFETHELPAMLDKKADKNHTHEFFTTIRADEIILNWAIASSSMRDEDMHTNLRDMVVDLANKTDKIYVDEELNRYDTKALSYTEEAKEWVNENYVKKSEVNEAVNDKINERFSNIDSITVNDIQLHHQLPGQKNVEYNNLTKVLDGFDEFRTDATNAITSMKTEILQAIYPIGALYTSMNSTNPASVLGFDTWQQIVDKFLYCANSSKQTGGSKKILEANLPPHKHTGTTNFSGDHSHSLRDHPLYNSDYEAGNDVLSPSYNNSAKKTFRPTEPGGNHSHTFTTNPTGSGEDYMPPFMTVFAWFRAA
ncbi:hypothetical protein TVAG_271270 [Trichomonas vaginalis G3]|uniref:Baseplate structural protein Gp10 C-terminal domain-containing protein n=1 Tax=Trichomonas vaginalis (strain ATCC PRA-98 / G3) TaxID=412133 RepID=A2EA96_TRIV3|nr:hypothetical protein TVAG_271270 [Trichomonas vaginalis G3]|eukprot:XP_001322659.1 hypothetical protein [Trichomonas vaginalis G3]